MSVTLMAAVWRTPLAAASKLVLLKLADHAHDDGTSARPGLAYLMETTNLSRTTVQRALRDLENDGLIEAVAHETGGRGLATEYRLHLEKGLNLTPFLPAKGPHPEQKGPHPEHLPSGRKEVVFMNHQEPKPPPGGGTPSATSPSQALVNLYVSECQGRGYTPVKAWRDILGSQSKKLLKEKPQDLIESAIRVIADERKHPAVLAHVIADLEAGRSANASPA